MNSSNEGKEELNRTENDALVKYVDDMIFTVKSNLKSNLDTDSHGELVHLLSLLYEIKKLQNLAIDESVSIGQKTLERIENNINFIKSNLDSELAPEIQVELANLIDLLYCLNRINNQPYYLIGSIEVAIQAVLTKPPKLEFSRKMRSIVRQRTPTSLFLRSNSPSVRVVLGLGMFLYIVIPILISSWRWIAGIDSVFGIPASMLGLVTAAGGLGSVVSIMSRVHDFGNLKDADPVVLFFTGFFKPIIGTSFALFLFALFNAGIIPIQIKTGSENYFFAAISFVAGFSERFAQDILSKTEKTVGGGSSEK
ncbi:hypothetical protein PN437_09300 [Microcystis aeruginosa CS-564/01]|nr:hypothetical protein [Microcystis aeruginosa CS-564/01]